nr:hypothetical protein [Sporomusa silvacetica]
MRYKKVSKKRKVSNDIESEGEFVRIKYPKTASQKHFASIKFCELDDKMTNKIVKYIFDKEIERRQKELSLFT